MSNMWKQFVLAASLLAIAAPATAQTAVGLKAGIVSSRFATDPEIADLSSLTDVSAGVFAIVNRRAPLTAQIEGLVTRRGASLGGDLLDLLPGEISFGDIVKIRGTYLDVSGLARAQFGQREQFYLLVGPTVGIRLNAEVSALGFSQDIDDIAKDYDVGATVGAGVDVNHLVLEARYTFGLTDLIPGVEIFNTQVRNRSFAVMAGMRF
jgi:hypothetical protein